MATDHSHHLRSRRAVAVVAVVLAALTWPAARASAQEYVAGDEARVQQMMNEARRDAGRAPLRPDDGLLTLARRQSARMAERGEIYHNPNLADEVTDLGMDWRLVGENVGVGPSVDAVEEAFMNSPHHHDNIVDARYQLMGVGVVDDDGEVYVTQVFVQLAQAQAPAAKAAAVKPAPTAPAVARPAPTVAAAVAAPTMPPTAAPMTAVAPVPTAVASGTVSHPQALPTSLPAEQGFATGSWRIGIATVMWLIGGAVVLVVRAMRRNGWLQGRRIIG